jgi:hypothetical protein
VVIDAEFKDDHSSIPCNCDGRGLKPLDMIDVSEFYKSKKKILYYFISIIFLLSK